jgi:hypothetical protein
MLNRLNSSKIAIFMLEPSLLRLAVKTLKINFKVFPVSTDFLSPFRHLKSREKISENGQKDPKCAHTTYKQLHTLIFNWFCLLYGGFD